MRAAVIGGGAWGTTMACLLARRVDTVLWAREPEVVEEVGTSHRNTPYLPGFDLPAALASIGDASGAVAGRDLVVVAVPAQHVRSVVGPLAEAVGPEAVVVSLTKGIEQQTLLRPTQILAEVLPGHDPARIGVLSGPNLAREVIAGEPSATVVAMGDRAKLAEVQETLMGNRFRVYVSHDVVGCEVGGAVKNVVALAAGMADGLGYGWNSRAALITRGLAELTRLGVALGGDPLTYLGLAGNGDLIATCCSPLSRNHRVGVELGFGRELTEILADGRAVAEGVATTPAVLAQAEQVGVELPIATQVSEVLAGRRTPTEAVEALMGRGPTSELHDLPGAAP